MFDLTVFPAKRPALNKKKSLGDILQNFFEPSFKEVRLCILNMNMNCYDKRYWFTINISKTILFLQYCETYNHSVIIVQL